MKKHGSILAGIAKERNIPCFELHTFDTLAEHIKDIAAQGVDIICIEGGDGTIHGVLSACREHATLFTTFPTFILLSGGMTNLIASQLGLKKPTALHIEKLLKNPNAGIRADTPLLNIEINDQTYSGFLFSTGALPNATRFCLDKIHTNGITGAAAVRTTLLRVLFGRGDDREIILTPTPFVLDIGDDKIDDDHITSIATTLPGLMIGVHPFWGSGNNTVQITHVRAGAKRHIRNIARMLKRKQSNNGIAKLGRDGFRSWSINTARIYHSGPLVLDGEFLPQTDGPISLSASTPICFLK